MRYELVELLTLTLGRLQQRGRVKIDLCTGLYHKLKNSKRMVRRAGASPVACIVTSCKAGMYSYVLHFYTYVTILPVQFIGAQRWFV